MHSCNLKKFEFENFFAKIKKNNSNIKCQVSNI